ncbi:MAG: sigma-70 family RNA polymerase sigma factor [Lachnospiraceae bacterium]|nr:sigma-70 family RNA polymerase sigma factor [Lachnospiraceae bacterium]
MDNLVKRAQRGDADAFAELIQSQMQNMYKTARAMLRDDEDAADAISDTILVCWEKLKQLKKEEFFKTWMTRILINKCNDYLRQRKKVYPVEEVEATPVSPEAYENIEWMEMINCLDEKYRLIMVLYYVNGFNTTEISAILHMSDSTVRTRLARGRGRMAELYTE